MIIFIFFIYLCVTYWEKIKDIDRYYLQTGISKISHNTQDVEYNVFNNIEFVKDIVGTIEIRAEYKYGYDKVRREIEVYNNIDLQRRFTMLPKYVKQEYL
jgi:hypothetical protein